MGLVDRGHRMAIGAALVAWVASADARAQELSAFGPGEQATYSLGVLGGHGATMQITIGAPIARSGEQALPVVVLTQTTVGIREPLLRYKLVTYWDPARSLCLGNDMAAVENGRWRREHIEVDLAKGQARVLKEKQGQPPQRNVLEVGQGAVDIIGVFLALRNEPLAVGQAFSFPVFSGTDAFTLSGTVEAVEVLQTAAGPRETFRVRMKTQFTGKAASKRDLIAWLSTDALHVPVRSESEFLFGTIRADLVKYESGRRYALAARPPP